MPGRTLPRISLAIAITLTTSLAHADVTFSVVNDWGSGAQVGVRIDNTTGAPIDGWTLTFDLEEQISQVWNGKLLAQEDRAVNVANADYNGVIAPGQVVEVGMLVRPGGIESTPDSILINGQPMIDGEPVAGPVEPTMPTEPTEPTTPTEPTEPTTPTAPSGGDLSVSKNGKLGINGSKLVNQLGELVACRQG